MFFIKTSLKSRSLVPSTQRAIVKYISNVLIKNDKLMKMFQLRFNSSTAAVNAYLIALPCMRGSMKLRPLTFKWCKPVYDDNGWNIRPSSLAGRRGRSSCFFLGRERSIWNVIEERIMELGPVHTRSHGSPWIIEHFVNFSVAFACSLH